jgi:hypothetical protein
VTYNDLIQAMTQSFRIHGKSKDGSDSDEDVDVALSVVNSRGNVTSVERKDTTRLANVTRRGLLSVSTVESQGTRRNSVGCFQSPRASNLSR